MLRPFSILGFMRSAPPSTPLSVGRRPHLSLSSLLSTQRFSNHVPAISDQNAPPYYLDERGRLGRLARHAVASNTQMGRGIACS
jgi:hypothetical protein